MVMAGRYPLLLLLLLLLLLVGLLAGTSEACGRDYSCSLNEVRGCGECPPNNSSSGMADRAGVGHMCLIGDSVVATTFTDIRRLHDSYLMLLEMPGVGIGNVKVQVDSAGILSISGLSREQHESRFHWERGAFTKLFARKFLLPPHVDAQGISHQLQDGLLRVTLPILPGGASSIASSIQQPGLTLDQSFCSVDRADEVVQPQALVGLNKPKPGWCNHGTDPESCQVTISKPPVDMLRREDNRVLLMVVEMPGVESAEVEVECRPGRLRGEAYDMSPVERGTTPGCFVSVRGVVEDDEEGELVRAERGGVRRKVFERSLFFKPGPRTIQAPYNGVYHLTNGLLSVPLRRVPTPGVWASALGFAASGLQGLHNMYRFRG